MEALNFLSSVFCMVSLIAAFLGQLLLGFLHAWTPCLLTTVLPIFFLNVAPAAAKRVSRGWDRSRVVMETMLSSYVVSHKGKSLTHSFKVYLEVFFTEHRRDTKKIKEDRVLVQTLTLTCRVILDKLTSVPIILFLQTECLTAKKLAPRKAPIHVFFHF